MGDESASIVMIAGTNCDENEARQLSDEPRNLPRLLDPGFRPEHVEQVPGNANEVKVLSLFDQLSKPVKSVVKIGGDKKLHGVENARAKSSKCHLS
jgi:hypothetical protein